MRLWTAEIANPVVLSLNVGSSSLKAAVRDPALRLQAHLEGLHGAGGRCTVTDADGSSELTSLPDGWESALAAVAAALDQRAIRPDVVAHRIVHGTALLTEPRRVDDDLLTRLRAEADHDPLHLPRQLAVIDESRRRWPGAPAVLCSDSAFHHRLPDEASVLPLPTDARSLGLRRWGFHGLALQSVVDALPELGPAVIAHLGSGCSVTAVQGGQSRHTTMSISPTGGIPSLTRSGDLDPDVVLRLVEAHSGSVPTVRALLTERSGIAGLTGGRHDLRDLLAARDSAADLAIRLFVRDVAMAVAGAVTTMDGWAALVFTGGIGAGSAEIRERVCARLLTLRPGAGATATGAPSERLAASGVQVLVVPVDEEAVMDRLVRASVRGHP